LNDLTLEKPAVDTDFCWDKILLLHNKLGIFEIVANSENSITHDGVVLAYRSLESSLLLKKTAVDTDFCCGQIIFLYNKLGIFDANSEDSVARDGVVLL